MSGGSKVVHQDYIVKQRYHNTLPPPPGAPKLLKIPFNPMNTYLSPYYTERMRRAEPINIEADAFLGMPIDLVGIPGVFEGDEKAIQAPLNPPPIHPRDKVLLRPLKALGKGGSEPSDISFLRRTQYVANDDRAGRGATSTASGFNPAPIKRRKIDASKEDPTTILRSTMKGFDIANQGSAPTAENHIRAIQPTKEELDAWIKPKHPSKPHLKVMDSYPLLPDLNAITNAPDGGFSLIKFMGQPTNIKDKHDERFDAGFLRSIMDELVIQDYQTRLRAHSTNPSVNPRPPPPAINFELFLPNDLDITRALKQKRDLYDEDRDSHELNTHHAESTVNDEPMDVIKLRHIRNYESGLQTEHEDKYQEVALALHDPDMDTSSNTNLLKAAYFYPITGKIQIKPRRKLGPGGDDDEDQANEMDLRFRDAEDEEFERRQAIKAKLEGKVLETPANGDDADADDDADGEEE